MTAAPLKLSVPPAGPANDVRPSSTRYMPPVTTISIISISIAFSAVAFSACFDTVGRQEEHPASCLI